MHHIAFEMKDFAHIQDACELLALRKMPINRGPVRHGPGHNVAIYHRNCDGHNVEFYIELDQMKDEELGYFDPRPWHHDTPQRPKAWDRKSAPSVWGSPADTRLLALIVTHGSRNGSTWSLPPAAVPAAARPRTNVTANNEDLQP